MKPAFTRTLTLLLAVLAVLLCAACTAEEKPEETKASAADAPETEEPYVPENSKYHEGALWCFKETEKDAKIDTFFLVPTACTGDFMNMPLDDAAITEKFTLQAGNQKGIYDDATRFFSPLYSQVTMQVYAMPETERAQYLDIAYADVKEAFSYYLHCFNGGNGIVLAGSSQGADMLMRLLKDFFNTEEEAKKLVCCYAIGWKITEEDMKALPFVHFATGEDDLGAVVSFNSESPGITSSFIVGENEKTLCINPLSWKCDTAPADASLNLGCCIYSTKGYQKGEDMVGFCGAYIDDARGTLKVTGVEAQDPDQSLYPSRLDGQAYGVFHIYDWEFFYRNLEKNVQTRCAKYLAE